MRLRKRAGGLLLGAGVVFLMGTNAQAGWLLVIASLLVGAVLAGVVLPLAGLRGLEAELIAPDETQQGGEAFVDVRLSHRGRGVRWSVLVRDDHLSPTDVFVDAVRAGERVEMTTRRSALRRGRRSTTSIEVRTAAPFGVAERRRTLPVRAETLVLPRVVALGPLPFVDPVGTADPAIHSSPRRGTGPEYLGIREYRPGDSMRRVHWPSTARHGAVMVREFEEERTRRLLVVVDTERDGDEPGALGTPLDRCCTVAASIASAALAHGHGARVVAATGSGVELLSRVDETELFRWLAELTASSHGLAPVLDDLGVDALRGAETVVFTLPAWAGDPGAVAEAASALAHRIPRVVAVPVSTVDVDDDDPALDKLVGALQDAAIETYPWTAGGDLAAALAASRLEPEPEPSAAGLGGQR